jgi:hypothetical protein
VNPPQRCLARCLVSALLALGPAIALPHPAAAAPATAAVTAAGLSSVAVSPAVATAVAGAGGCPVGGVEVDLAGSGDTAVVSGHAAGDCRTASGSRQAGGPRPYWTYEIACSPDAVRAADGLCSATPCQGGLFFAFRTLHRPDGRAEAAGYSCVSLERALASPALTAADVFAAVRQVELPGGAIRIAPSGRGLANVPSRLWLVGDARAPVNLRLAGSTVHAEFEPVQYRWTFDASRDGANGPDDGTQGKGGDGVSTVPALAHSSGRDGEAGMVFPTRGDFVVSVVTTWSAAAFLDGRYVGQVDGLVSTARIAYPVSELRTALSG